MTGKYQSESDAPRFITEPEADEWQGPMIDKSAQAAFAFYLAGPRAVRGILNRSEVPAFVSDRHWRALNLARHLRDGIL